MAIIKYGALVSGVRGTIGGVTFTAGKSGPYAKMWSRGANPRTELQSNDRLRMSLMPARWRALSDSEREAWDDWAALPANEQTNALGDAYYLSGWESFVRINVRLLRAGRSIRDDPPVESIPAAPVIDTFTFAEVSTVPTVEIDYDPGEFPSGIDIVLRGTVFAGTARLAGYSGWRVVLAGIASPTGTYDFLSEWSALFGAPVLEQQAFIEVYAQTDDGQRSTASALSAVYVAV